MNFRLVILKTHGRKGEDTGEEGVTANKAARGDEPANDSHRRKKEYRAVGGLYLPPAHDAEGQNQLKKLGAAGATQVGTGNFQALFETKSELLKDRIRKNHDGNPSKKRILSFSFAS